MGVVWAEFVTTSNTLVDTSKETMEGIGGHSATRA